MSTSTSIGPDASRGGNDNPGNADGCGNKTLGSEATPRAPTGADDDAHAAPRGAAGAPGNPARPGAKPSSANLDDPQGGSGPRGPDAAQGR